MPGPHEAYLCGLAARMGGQEDLLPQGYFGVLGAAWDTCVDRVLAAVRAGRLLEAGDDALAFHGRNRGFVQAHAESSVSFRAWLADPWTKYREMGSVAGLTRNLARLGYPNARYVSALDLYNAGVMGAFGITSGLLGPVGEYVGFGYLDIDHPNGFSPAPDWDGGADWDGSATWDLSEPYTGALGDIRQTVWRWKAFGRSVRFARIRVPNPTDAKLSHWLTFPIGERWEWDENGSISGPYLQDFMVA